MASTVHISPQEKKFYIPRISIEPFLKDPDSAASKAIVEDVRAACQSTGFFEITGHGIPKSLQKDVLGAASQFFKLPFDEKKKLDASKQIGYRGYDMLASQAYGKDLLPDLKEGFYIGIDIPETDPRAGRFFTGPNVWPDESLLPASQFKYPCTRYFSAMLELSFKIMGLLARTLPYGPHIFDDFIANDPAAPLRLLHYPPPPSMTSADPEEQKKQYGASAHTDFGAITILLQDENPGLEVFDQNTNSWVPIDPNPDAYVVNVGL
ncbi:hypothetical protein Plec18167_002172 [Paecilomyces lecythidis]|uniref:Fe2OG dioxygenase domain-containing protein n=1 Tax=Paecilomyces lecythidis TaxID=3004212 RepID=A0ABR3Y8G2_9EURO